MRIKLLLVLFLSLFLLLPSFAQEKKVIRVALSNQSFSVFEHKNVKLLSDDKIKIIDMSQNSSDIIIEPKVQIEIKMEENLYNIYIGDELKYEKLQGPLLLSSNSYLQIVDLNRKGSPAKYSGMIELHNAKNAGYFNIINVVDMQNYLRGVVPNEMPISFGLEALKAQAIAARNYAINANMSPNYDLVDSTAAQVYYGANSYRDISDTAVNQTNGIYALYHNKPITALYFSTSIGITDDWDDVFGNGYPSGAHPYLKARYDNINQKPLKTDEDVKEFLSKKDTGFDTNSPKFRWEFEFTRKELEEVFKKTLYEQSKAGLVEPKFEQDSEFIGLKQIKALKRTQSGKVTELLVESKSGNYKIKKELGIRRVIKKNNSMLPSANFYVESIGEEVLEEDNKPDDDDIPVVHVGQESGLTKLFEKAEKEKYPATFKFIGGGFGHGVGMSQFGAYNLAKNSKKYPEILNHYYSNINISTIPKTVLYNDYNVWYPTEFYFDKTTFQNAYLIIENSNYASCYPFKINDYDFSDTLKASRNRLVKINITEYLKNGLNKINFAPLTSENRGKQVIYRVELQ